MLNPCAQHRLFVLFVLFSVVFAVSALVSLSSAPATSTHHHSDDVTGTALDSFSRRGLLNLHNTCFMNAILQCLLHCSEFWYFCMRFHQILDTIEPELDKIDETTDTQAHTSSASHIHMNQIAREIPITYELITFAAHFRRKNTQATHLTTPAESHTTANETLAATTTDVAHPHADSSIPASSSSSPADVASPSTSHLPSASSNSAAPSDATPPTAIAAASTAATTTDSSNPTSVGKKAKKKKKKASDRDDAFLDSLVASTMAASIVDPLEEEERRKAKNRAKKEKERARAAAAKLKESTSHSTVDDVDSKSNLAEDLTSKSTNATAAPTEDTTTLSASQRKKLKRAAEAAAAATTIATAPEGSPSVSSPAVAAVDPIPVESATAANPVAHTAIAAADDETASAKPSTFLSKKQSRVTRVEDEEEWTPIIDGAGGKGKKKNNKVQPSSNKPSQQPAQTTQKKSLAPATSASSSTSSSTVTPPVVAPLGPPPTSSPFLPSFTHLLRAFHSHKQGQQEDAQELLQILCENVQREWTTWIGKNGGPASSSPSSTMSDLSDQTNADDWSEVGKGSKTIKVVSNLSFAPSPLSRLFCGRVRSQLSVASRSTDTMSFQPFFALHLDIDEQTETMTESNYHNDTTSTSKKHHHRKKPFTIEKALERYMCPSEIEGYRKSSAPAYQQVDAYGYPIVHTTRALHMHALDSHALPRILVLHLKRFEQLGGGGIGGVGRTVKSTKHVKFSSRLTLPGKYLSTAASTNAHAHAAAHYDLVGVVVHIGHSMAGGHYISYVRDRTLEPTTSKSITTTPIAASADHKSKKTRSTTSKGRTSFPSDEEESQDEDDHQSSAQAGTGAPSSAREIWYQCDDSRITPLPAHNVYAQCAYLLFYTIVEPDA